MTVALVDCSAVSQSKVTVVGSEVVPSAVLILPGTEAKCKGPSCHLQSYHCLFSVYLLSSTSAFYSGTKFLLAVLEDAVSVQSLASCLQLGSDSTRTPSQAQESCVE